MRSTLKIGAAALALSFAGVANAATIVPVSVAASSDRPDYAAGDAIDQDAGSAVSDWATNNTGAVNAFLNVDLGALYNLTGFTATDRVTSGSGNNQFVGGLFDFTTAFTFQAYTDATFTTTLGGLFNYSKTAPVSPDDPSDFAFTGALPLSGVQYVRYTVTATNGANPGLSNLVFEGAAVPEPTTWAMMILGFGFVGAALRTRRRAPLAA